MTFEEARGLVRKLYGKSWKVIQSYKIEAEEAVHVLYAAKEISLPDHEKLNWLSLKLTLEEG